MYFWPENSFLALHIVKPFLGFLWPFWFIINLSPQTPVLAGKPISLHLLFERVTKLGGSYILSNEDRWQDILQGIYTATTCSSLHLPPSHDELVQRRPTNLDRPIFKLFF